MFETVMLLVSSGLCVWSLVNVTMAWRFHTKAKQLVAECRTTAEQCKTAVTRSDELQSELKRVSERSKELHADAVRLLAEADQVASQARDGSE